ncbi:MAG: GntR family transcriptional regulator [Peptoniphilus sp.]|nr:GntR family transcriptional regulator [Peptoniphilus sp.]MDY3118925.1 GntR family transcriptional regulator [Peptoniphilus sp.]
MDFDGNRPIYLQLYETVRKQIASGELLPGEKLESVRNLAKVYGVNPNTVQRALQELEREALIETDRTRGKFVTENKDTIDALGKDAFFDACDQLIDVAENLSMSQDVAVKLLNNRWEKGGSHEGR